ncbi:MAG: hypothetical protein CVV06_10450, partial [Gammaproteobacteria bacterium HGW-Gammaproteobacteria-10]
ERGKRKEERGKRKEERGKRKEERGKRKEERGKRGRQLKEKTRHSAMDSLRTILPGALRVNANPLHTDLWRKPGSGMAMHGIVSMSWI